MTAILMGVLRPLEMINNVMGILGKYLAVFALGIMVFVTLLQVFFRYILNNALPWPDEAARFMMLWLAGLMGPVALRQGGFVAIDMISILLPAPVRAVLGFILLLMSSIVLIAAWKLGWNHVNSGWLFASSSLKIPLDWFGYKVIKIKLAWMYLSMFVGVVLMCLVSAELVLRQIISAFGGGAKLRPIPQVVPSQGAE